MTTASTAVQSPVAASPVTSPVRRAKQMLIAVLCLLGIVGGLGLPSASAGVSAQGTATPALWSVHLDGCRYQWVDALVQWQSVDCNYSVQIKDTSQYDIFYTEAWIGDKWVVQELFTYDQQARLTQMHLLFNPQGDVDSWVTDRYWPNGTAGPLRMTVDASGNLLVEAGDGTWWTFGSFFASMNPGQAISLPNMGAGACTQIGVGFMYDWNGDNQVDYLDNEYYCGT